MQNSLLFRRSMKFKYICNDCQAEYSADEIRYTCPVCEKKNNSSEFRYGNLNVEIDEGELKKVAKKKLVSPDDFAVYKIKNPDAYPIGGTPLSKPLRIQEKLGLDNLYFKLDSQLPSGSFKDRASQAVIAQAQHFNVDKIALASTGNAGAAMSCAGAAYGMKIVLFVPESAPVNKLMQSILYAADVVPVKGTYDDAFNLSIFYTEKFGGLNRNTAYNPITIEGKKSVSIELFEQFNRQLPDVIYVPVGDGCIISGVAKGFVDLLRAGLIDKLPHLVAVQSDKSDAIANAFETGKFRNLDKATTIADSISVASPAAGRQAVMRIKESGGWAVKVSDAEILEAQLELSREAGVFVEPAASASYAGLKKDVSELKKKFTKDVKVLCLFTGTAFKDMKVFNSKVSMPLAIENSHEALLERFNSLG